MSRILVTSALPYANGPIHIGHLVEHIQTDIFVRFHRLMGNDVLHFCADDTHGSGIELNARKMGITPQELVEKSGEEHRRDFDAFQIGFDLYYTTESEENRELAEYIYGRLKDQGHVVRKKSEQMYSEHLGRFLPDRWVKGTCPKCKAPDQYGDQCEVCNSTYEPGDLIDPYDVVEGKTPIVKETEQLYVRLSDFTDYLKDWVERGVPQQAVRSFVNDWFERGLDDWCISRDAPYFGFQIPGEEDKYFYVWLDAPIGYIATTKKYCSDNGLNWKDWWGVDADSKIVHVIGKDITYFHTLFWPAMLKASDLKEPDVVHAHGFLTVNGEKMSKSKGTFIRASTYLEHLDPNYLRFYFAAKLSKGIEDMDLNLEDFVNRVNADLVNNALNLANRVTKFMESKFDGEVAPFDPSDYPVCARVSQNLEGYRGAMEEFDFRGAMRLLAEAGDRVNTFFQDAEPWKVIKEDEEKAAEICAVALYGATALLTALKPVVPEVAARYADAIGVDELQWAHASVQWQPEKVRGPDTLLPRIELKDVEAMVEASKDSDSLTEEDGGEELPNDLEPLKDEISFGEFSKVDLRVGVIKEAADVEGADKLLRLIVDIGKPMTVFAGIRKAYPDPEVLVGQRAIVVANLAPRKMRFGTSEGMLLATSAPDDEGLQLFLGPESAEPGWTIR
jgi:methionyl-tRNA synthetase